MSPPPVKYKGLLAEGLSKPANCVALRPAVYITAPAPSIFKSPPVAILISPVPVRMPLLLAIITLPDSALPVAGSFAALMVCNGLAAAKSVPATMLYAQEFKPITPVAATAGISGVPGIITSSFASSTSGISGITGVAAWLTTFKLALLKPSLNVPLINTLPAARRFNVPANNLSPLAFKPLANWFTSLTRKPVVGSKRASCKSQSVASVKLPVLFLNSTPEVITNCGLFAMPKRCKPLVLSVSALTKKFSDSLIATVLFAKVIEVAS